ncbi:hypothetical protein [Lysobacter sp. GCM10012299]|uniref:hypothetical protein n=1 Tax=Lysobacter sp. GCM10012299 TaxID=3317333 RepID=UPI00361BAE06
MDSVTADKFLFMYKGDDGADAYYNADQLPAGTYLSRPATSEIGTFMCSGLAALVGEKLSIVWEPPPGAMPFATHDGTIGGVLIDSGTPGVAVGISFSGGITLLGDGTVLIAQSSTNVPTTGGINVSTITRRRYINFVLVATGAKLGIARGGVPLEPVAPIVRLGRLKYVAAPQNAASGDMGYTSDMYLRNGQGTGTSGPVAGYAPRFRSSTCHLIERGGGEIGARSVSINLQPVDVGRLSTRGASVSDLATLDWKFNCDGLLDPSRWPELYFSTAIPAPADVGVALPDVDALVGIQIIDSLGAPIPLDLRTPGLGWTANLKSYQSLDICVAATADCSPTSSNWTALPRNAGNGTAELSTFFPLTFRYYRRSDKDGEVQPGPIQARFTVTLETP